MSEPALLGRSAGPCDAGYAALFRPLRLGGLSLCNRLAVAPMTRTSATVDGLATERMARYYASFARGGFSLIITEGTYTDDAYSQGYDNQPGLASAAQAAAWSGVVGAVHQGGARLIVQLMHAGALAQGNRFRADTIAPSMLQPRGEKQPSYGGSGPFARPRAATQAELHEIVSQFVAAARRAQEAGFDGVEIHAGNGYLIDQFLTDYTNQRADEYGGPIEHRVRFAVDVIAAVRRGVGATYTIGVRLSQSKINDREHKWAGGESDAAVIFRGVVAAGADYIHVTERDAAAPAFGEGPTLAALAKRYGGVPVIANGKLHEPARAAELLRRGDADVVALAKGALANMDWPRRVAANRDLAPFSAEALRTLRTL